MSSSPQTKLTILVTSVTGVGHINACIGATTELLFRGHRVVFVLESAWKGKLASLGFEEYIYTEEVENEEQQESPEATPAPGEAMAKYLLAAKSIGPYSPEEKMKSMTLYFKSLENRQKFALCNTAIMEAIETYAPNLIWVDGGLRPAVRDSGIPWIQNFSANPTFLIIDDDLPPGGFGLPTAAGGDRSTWEHYNSIRRQILFSSDYNDAIEELGYSRYPGDAISPIQEAALVVYGFPAELNYPQIAAKPWFNLEVFNRYDYDLPVPLPMLISESFMKRCLVGAGKLIYLSMGSMGSVDLELMKRLVTVLGTTKHKYIVSKGPRHAEFSLPSNMFGDRYLPQQKILPHVDLVISHGGANTVAETIAEGKPLLVLPLFADQYDTAQRLEETELGVRLDAYDFTDGQLTDAIERLLYDQELKGKLEAASRRIKSGKQHKELAEKIEEMFSTN